jgi:hypothetical protein
VEPVQVVAHHHVEGRGGGALLVEAADVQAGVVGEAVDERRTATGLTR